MAVDIHVEMEVSYLNGKYSITSTADSITLTVSAIVFHTSAAEDNSVAIHATRVKVIPISAAGIILYGLFWTSYLHHSPFQFMLLTSKY